MNDDDAPAPPSIRGASYQRFIGRGGFSHVYLFRQRQLGRGVAVKVLDREVDDRARRRFEAETSLMARMSPHPSVVSVIDAGRAEDGREYIVMEYCPPPDLGRIARSEPLSVEQALKYAIQVAGAVETIHRAGYLHRDIKPSNILLTEYRRPVLTDFGIATPIEAQDVEDESGGASPPWAPPEQLRGEEALTLAADVYGLAATVYTMLTGHAPHTDRAPDGRNDLLSMLQRAQAGRIPPITRPDAPEQLRRVLRTAMAPRPENRFATVLAFARELQQVQRSLGQAPTAASWTGSTPRPDPASTPRRSRRPPRPRPGPAGPDPPRPGSAGPGPDRTCPRRTPSAPGTPPAGAWPSPWRRWSSWSSSARSPGGRCCATRATPRWSTAPPRPPPTSSDPATASSPTPACRT